jgi:hypothetical protein
VIFEALIQILAKSDILEHLLQLRSIVCTACLLQSSDHVGFCVIGSRRSIDESTSQHLGIEFLENVLVFDILEDGHLQSPSVNLAFDKKVKKAAVQCS